jgi:hypothetical protein
MLRTIDAAGTPAGEHGEEVRRAIRNAIEQFRPVVADLVVQAQNLPTRNVTVFMSEAEELNRSAMHSFTGVANAFSDLQYLGGLGIERPEACRA